MEKYLVFFGIGMPFSIEASSMETRTAAKRIVFFDGMKEIASFDSTQISKAGLARLFPDYALSDPDGRREIEEMVQRFHVPIEVEATGKAPVALGSPARSVN
jgi:hypothetical protein